MKNEQQLQSLEEAARAGFDAVERGEFTGYEVSDIGQLAERVKARGRERLRGEEREGS